VPRIFQYSATQVVCELGLEKPCSPANIVLARPKTDRLPRDCKLRAATYTNQVRYLDSRHQLLEGLLINAVGGYSLLHREVAHDVDVGPFEGIMLGTDLDRTAQDPDATQVDVSRRAHIVELQVAERREAIVIGVVVMPSKASGVRKDSDGSERIIAVDDVTANVTNVSDSTQTTHLVEQDGKVEDDSRQVYHSFAALVLWNR